MLLIRAAMAGTQPSVFVRSELKEIVTVHSRRFVVTGFAISSPIVGLVIVLCASSSSWGGPSPTTQTPTAPALIAQGKAVNGTLDCNTCHTIGSAGTAVGPDLTSIGKTWTTARLKTMIRHPTQIAPKGYMPAYPNTKISKTQLTAVAAYLASLK